MRQINVNNTVISLDEAKANPEAFISAVGDLFTPKKLAFKKDEAEDERVVRLFMSLHRKGFGVTSSENKTKVAPAQVAEMPKSVPQKVETVTTEHSAVGYVMQTPTALAMNAKELAIDILVRISDIVLHHVYTDEANQFPNDLMQALKDLSDAAKAVKSAAETVNTRTF